jgi:hypothetical protein
LRSYELRRLLVISVYFLVCLFVVIPSGAYLARQAAPPPPAPPRPGTGPPRPEPRDIVRHLQDIRWGLDHVDQRDADSDRVIGIARRILLAADQKLKSKDFLTADRLVGAADAFLHVAQHLSRLIERPQGPMPQRQEISEHLQHVYFRLQQVDFFSRSSADPDGEELSTLARKYYEQSRKQYDARNWFSSDEYAKSADDLVRGLENLAQAATPQPPLPPRP